MALHRPIPASTGSRATRQEVAKFCERHISDVVGQQLKSGGGATGDMGAALASSFLMMDTMLSNGQGAEDAEQAGGDGPDGLSGGRPAGEEDEITKRVQMLRSMVVSARISEAQGAGVAPGQPAIVNGEQVCTLPEHEIQAGCTAVAALVRGRDLVVAWAGDSRGVLSRKGKAVPLSTDHKPNQERERSRITQAGGFVKNMGGHYRVNGNLNLSRAIGDLKYKANQSIRPEEQIITANPDITQNVIGPEDEFMVLACDGIWDVMSNQEVVDFVRGRLRTHAGAMGHRALAQLASQLLDNCLATDPKITRGIGGDNMTAIIVQFV